jgi:exodeoxyribonuclease V alpha subunit
MSTATILGTPPEEALAVGFARLVRVLHLRAGGRPEDAEAVAFAASLISRAASDGQSFLDVAGIEAQELLRPINYFPSSGPPLETWLKQLARSPVVACSGDPNDFRPLVLVGGTRLYLYRYFDYERRLAARLAEMNRPAALPCPAPVAAALLSRLFPREGGVRPDWQKIAAATALLRRLCIVSGGPGTGKTTTVVKVLALLLHGARLQRRCGRGTAGAGRPLPRTFPAPRWWHPPTRPQPPARARDRLRHVSRSIQFSPFVGIKNSPPHG